MPTNFEEKFKRLNTNNNLTEKPKHTEKNEDNSSIFKELIKNISQNISRDEILILMLLLIFRKNNKNNSLTLALLYMLLWNF